jgi:hypothetical protein
MAPAGRPPLLDTLLALEREGWQALSGDNGTAFYDAHLIDDAAMVLPVVGLLDRAASIEAMAAAPQWASFAIDEPRVIALDETNAVLVYRATARRTDEPEYRALMSTTYTRHAEGWRIALHQQTVIEPYSTLRPA